jgi:hypothetical protein
MSTPEDGAAEAVDARAAARRARLGHELLLAGVCLAIGLLVMPCLIFVVGSLVLGPYAEGGVFGLWRAFLAGLASGSQAFWFILLGPYLLLWLLRGGRQLLHNQPRA